MATNPQVRVWDTEEGTFRDVDLDTAHSLFRADRFKDHNPNDDEPDTSLHREYSWAGVGVVAPELATTSTGQGSQGSPASDPAVTKPTPATATTASAPVEVQQESEPQRPDES